MIMGRHISDTGTMRREIYYVHPLCGRTLFVDTLCMRQAAGVARPLQSFVAAKICGQS